ncbi:hypothetical protein M2447_001266 [Ereboglobus sp. PH5-10]|uniref:hypothetical protein n=1 Tax=Ereboglobus sp. PH5-10 TaxID=2940629 RepID=UPI00240617F4|nr:hypothetical protein [Ereboglobus sp. PH5-10]MDF9827177.1 hypothetical protein [Ereboglobus sp. PH5-10]
MALWEYKVITSGIHGFATPALLETYLNNLGKDEWEIVNYQPSPTNSLAFTGLVRRPTQRDWTPPAALVPVTPPAPAPEKTASPADVTQTAKSAPTAPAAEASQATPDTPPATDAATDTAPTPAATLRPVRDTERDHDPEALAEDDAADTDDEWDDLDFDDDLPTFFDALKPHMRNNQKGPGQSVAVDYLVKRWQLPERDIVGALKECGLTIPETEDAEPEYFEFEDDLYWVNRNNRGQLFINTREKPQPKFRTVPATPLSPDDPAYAELAAERAEEKARVEKRNAERAARAEEAAKRRAERQEASAKAASSDETAPDDEGTARVSRADSVVPDAAQTILDRIRPKMRRNRHGPGISGSVGFLARALETTDEELTAALTGLGLQVPATPNEKPTFVEIGASLYWLNKDNRGNIWINARDNKNGAKKTTPPADADGAQTAKSASTDPVGASRATPDAPPPAPDAPTDEDVASDAPTLAPDEGTARVPRADSVVPDEGTARVPRADSVVPDEGTARVPRADSVVPGEGTARVPRADSVVPDAAPIPHSPLDAVRPLLKPNKRGSGVSGEVGYLARALDQGETEFVAGLTDAGLVVPPDADTKPTFVEHNGEIFWFGLFEKAGETSVWLNAKPAKAKRKTAGAPRARKPKAKAKPDADQPAE